jgi:tryptophanyl-tRNA synthetase
MRGDFVEAVGGRLSHGLFSPWNCEMKRIFSGIQPTGEIHIGNYLGAIQNWVSLMDDYDCIYCIVDYHAITIDFELHQMESRILETAMVNIGCGLDPERCSLFVQSHVPEHTELAWIFNCITPIGELERMTQFKDKSKQHRHNINMGLLDYPVLQAADILLYKAHFVPVGEDQFQHVELTREIARKFNKKFGKVFPEPQVLSPNTPRILGLDGKKKMSKSLNNYLGLTEPEEEIWEKLRKAVTDEARKRRTDPGDPDICNIFTIHGGFGSKEDLDAIDRRCREATIGCVDHKRILYEDMMAHLTPIRNRIEELRGNIDFVKEALENGARQCKEIAVEVMDEVKAKTGLRALKPN